MGAYLRDTFQNRNHLISYLTIEINLFWGSLGQGQLKKNIVQPLKYKYDGLQVQINEIIKAAKC